VRKQIEAARQQTTEAQVDSSKLRRSEGISQTAEGRSQGETAARKQIESAIATGVRKQQRETAGNLVIAAAARRQIEAARLQKADQMAKGRSVSAAARTQEEEGEVRRQKADRCVAASSKSKQPDSRSQKAEL
jgi:hypothetical protein